MKFVDMARVIYRCMFKDHCSSRDKQTRRMRIVSPSSWETEKIRYNRHPMSTELIVFARAAPHGSMSSTLALSLSLPLSLSLIFPLCRSSFCLHRLCQPLPPLEVNQLYRSACGEALSNFLVSKKLPTRYFHVSIDQLPRKTPPIRPSPPHLASPAQQIYLLILFHTIYYL